VAPDQIPTSLERLRDVAREGLAEAAVRFYAAAKSLGVPPLTTALFWRGFVMAYGQQLEEFRAPTDPPCAEHLARRLAEAEVRFKLGET